LESGVAGYKDGLLLLIDTTNRTFSETSVETIVA
jgi:hypothetical protein